MSSPRYERVRLMRSTPPLHGEQLADRVKIQVSGNDQDDHVEYSPVTPDTEITPSSPPPSFRSRASSPSSRHLLSSDPISTEAERTLADTFDDGSDSDDEAANGGDDRQRLMRANTGQSSTEQRAGQDGGRPDLPRTVTRFPGVETIATANVPTRPHTGGTPFNNHSQSNDGVFANLNAKPERGEKLEEQPPVCTQATEGKDFLRVLTHR